MRNIRLAVLVLAVLGVLPRMAGAETRQEQSTLDIPVAGIRSLRVENGRGLVTVSRGAGSRIHLTALKIVRSRDDAWARRVARQTQVETDMRGGEYEIRVVYPQRQAIRVRFWDLFSDFEFPNIEVRLAIEVPDGLPLTLESTSGDLISSGVRATQVLESTSGDVTVTGAATVNASSTSGDVHISDAGPSRVRTVSGDLVAQRMRGPLAASTTSGDVRVSESADSLVLATVSGDITVDAAPRGLELSTTSGTVDVRRASGIVRVQSTSGDAALGFVAPVRRTQIVTGNGDVRLRFAPALAYSLDLATSSGEIQVEVPLDVENVTRHRLTGVVRHGATPIVVHTVSGDISIAEGAR